MSKKILLIVEGEADEVRFFRQLFKCCYRTLDFQFYSYRTNLHVLAQELYNNYPDFENDNIDIRLILSSLEPNDDKKKILKEEYSDVYMIFDFEPQDHNTHYDTVQRMLSYFVDSTEQGKLFINYPMMQSYKHFSKLPDKDFDNKTVTIDQVKKYKSLVNTESKFTDLSKYDYRTFYSIAYHHLRKAYGIQFSKFCCPTRYIFCQLDYQDIYVKQVDLVESKGQVWTLNTCVLGIIEFSPKKYFDFVEKRKEELYI